VLVEVSLQCYHCRANGHLILGGNDVGLLGVLNQCIYQIGSLTKEQVAVAKLAAEVDEQYAWAKDVDWDSLGLGCEAQLQRTSSIATSQAFKTSLDNVISAAKKKLKSGYAPLYRLWLTKTYKCFLVARYITQGNSQSYA
jgi:hypothetical protein